MSRLIAVFLLLVLLFVDLTSADDPLPGQQVIRAKRNYYGGFDAYGDDFWYAGRIIGIIAGIFLLLLCCCLPCVCLVGIWFLGWFGFRQSRRRAENKAPATTVSVAPYSSPANVTEYPTSPPVRTRNVVVESSPRDSSSVRNFRTDEQVIYAAEDRYYTSSTAPAPPHQTERKERDARSGAGRSQRLLAGRDDVTLLTATQPPLRAEPPNKSASSSVLQKTMNE
ncbi:unnamed protein product [Caenorhabditis auriculariae]|uniref:Uncharacterized protein n=1 Tax=Caenorhabditis auriculariae TaxID=2777116 RepID=A0A8S1HPF2_9PELO|nr:unnamed protein product [Caenorhabditis auriculariae]